MPNYLRSVPSIYQPEATVDAERWKASREGLRKLVGEGAYDQRYPPISAV